MCQARLCSARDAAGLRASSPSFHNIHPAAPSRCRGAAIDVESTGQAGGAEECPTYNDQRRHVVRDGAIAFVDRRGARRRGRGGVVGRDRTAGAGRRGAAVKASPTLVQASPHADRAVVSRGTECQCTRCQRGGCMHRLPGQVLSTASTGRVNCHDLSHRMVPHVLPRVASTGVDRHPHLARPATDGHVERC